MVASVLAQLEPLLLRQSYCYTGGREGLLVHGGDYCRIKRVMCTACTLTGRTNGTQSGLFVCVICTTHTGPLVQGGRGGYAEL